MSLATRCTQCGTVFRVVQDQLKVSEGWVRCGRCDEVFNALEGLFDLERDSPPASPIADAQAAVVSSREEFHLPEAAPRRRPPLPQPLTRSHPTGRPMEEFDRPQTHATRPSQFGRPSGFDSPMLGPTDDTPTRLRSAPPPAPPRSLPPSPPPAPPLPSPPPPPERHVSAPMPFEESLPPSRRADRYTGPETIIGEPIPGIDFAAARLSSELLVDPDTPVGVVQPGTAEAEALAIAQQTRPAPAFVRKAEIAERWQSPLVKASLTMLALLLAIGFALQWAHHNRNMIAARWPGTQPLLAQWCAAADCSIEAPQNLADVHIESSALTPASPPAGAPDGASAVKLAVVLRNHGDTKVALPSLDVTLTDGAGQVVSRKALAPADFGIALPELATGAETSLQVVLTTGARKAAGYTVDVFYP